jgi:hypothetical protein
MPYISPVLTLIIPVNSGIKQGKCQYTQEGRFYGIITCFFSIFAFFKFFRVEKYEKI